MKYIYIINRFQHKKNWSRLIQALGQASERLRRDYVFHINESPEAAALSMDQYRETDYVITAVGGDGSVNILLNHLMGTRNILSFIPIGTGNDFFHVCRDTLLPGIQALDVIRINDRYFINTACFGIDADIANDDHFIHNRLIPRPLRYHAGVLYHFFSYKEGRRLKVQWDENTVEKTFTTLVAANGRYYGGGYKVSPGSQLNDGHMEVYLVDKISRPRMAAMILSMKKAGHLKNPALHMIRTDRLQISSDRLVKANIDGESLAGTCFDLELIHKGIQVDYNLEMIRCFHEQYKKT